MGRNTFINLATVVLYNGLMKIAIIGGGAAGIMAAATARSAALKKGAEIFLIEKKIRNY